MKSWVRKLSLVALVAVALIPFAAMLRIEWIKSRGSACIERLLKGAQDSSCRLGPKAVRYLERAQQEEGQVMGVDVIQVVAKADGRWGAIVDVQRKGRKRREHWDSYGSTVGAITSEIVLASSIIRHPSAPQH